MSRAARITAVLVVAAFVVLVMDVLSPAGALTGARGTKAEGESNLVSFGQDLRIDSRHSGGVQVLGGNVSIAAHVTGDVAVFGGDIAFEPGAVVDGDLFCLGGQVSGLEDARVAGQIFAPRNALVDIRKAGITGLADPRAVSFVTVAVKLSLLLVWLVAAIILTLVNGREIRASSVELRASALHCLLLGLVGFTSLALATIVFSLLIPYLVGIPLLAALGLFAIVAKVYGTVAVFHAIGSMIAGAKNRQELSRRRWLRGDMAMVVIGVMVLGGLHLIPLIGNPIWMVASLFGFGVSIATKFGRREPWFLTWRPATEASR